MKRILLIIFLIFFSIAKSEKRIELGLQEFPPIQSVSMEGYGMIPEIITAAFEEVDYEVDYKFYPTARLKRMLVAGEVLGALSVKEFFTLEEREKISFTPFVDSKIVLFYLKSKFPHGISYNSVEDLSNLANYKVGLVIGVPEIKLLESNGLIVEQSSSNEAVFKKLIRGRIDLASTLDVIGLHVIKKLGKKESEFEVSNSVLEILGSLALSKDYSNYEEIRDEFKKGLFIIEEKGILDKILKKYYGEKDFLIESFKKKLKVLRGEK